MRKMLRGAVTPALIAWSGLALAQAPQVSPPTAPRAPATAGQHSSAPDPASQALIAKLNAYVGVLNRTLRAQESLTRYESWVDMKKGPTGRERIIYGLYSVYDMRSEIDEARAAMGAEPAMPELDSAMKSYIAAYEALAPTLNTANAYYDRKDYTVDKMAEGKELHAKIAKDGPVFLSEREKVEPLFAKEKARSDALELAAIEKREGRSARWQMTTTMIAARQVMDTLPKQQRPVVDMPAFEAALSRYGAVVKDLDAFAAAHPGTLSTFESQPRSLLGKLRDFREKLVRVKGDARRGPGSDLTWIVSTYNMMVSQAETASRFAK